MAVDPIHQFQITDIFAIGRIGGQEIAFTNSSAYMFASVAVISLLMIAGTRGRQLVPGRIQSLAELIYEFDCQHDQKHRGLRGHEVLPAGVLAVHVHHGSNVIGIIPYAFTVSSHLIVTAALALLVFFRRAVLWPVQERPEILQAVRAVGCPDLHSAAGRADRNHSVLLREAAFAFAATFRQYAGRSHRAESVRELCRYARHSRFDGLDWLPSSRWA